MNVGTAILYRFYMLYIFQFLWLFSDTINELKKGLGVTFLHMMFFIF